MKKSSLITTLFMLAALAGCVNKNSSTSSSSEAKPSSPAVSTTVSSTTVESSSSSSSATSSSTSSSTNSSTSSSTSSSTNSSTSSSTSSSTNSSTSSSTSSSTNNSTSTVPVENHFLEDLQEGFVAKSVYSKAYNSGTPSLTLLKTFVGNGAAKWEQYSGSSWENVTEGTAPYKVAQYESDAEENAQIVSVDTAGNPIYTPLLLKDALSGENVEAFWSEANLDNAFARFTKDNFTKQEDGTYALDLSETALANADYADAVAALARQMYMILQGSEYSGFYFVEEKLTSYVVTVDGNGKPVSYAAEFEAVKKDDGLGGVDTVYTSVSGTFEKTGSDSLSKVVAGESKYEELDEAFATLKEHNYAFNVKREEKDDWAGNSTQTITGESDGKGNFYVDYVNKGEWSSSEQHYGYAQTGENTYRKYLVGETSNIWNGEEQSGSALDILPSFLFSSALFTKDEAASTETTTVYNFDKPVLIDTNYSTDLSIINFGFSSIQGWSLVDLSVEVSDSTIVFKNVTSASRSMEATFSKLGEVTPISATANDVKDLVAGKYTSTNTINGTEITFDVTIQKDGVFAITKDGENFGSFGYTVDASNKIVLDAAVETRTFNISQTTGEGEDAVTKNYTCNINKTVSIDDPYNPSKVTLEVKSVEEGKTWGSTTRFTAERVVEPTPTYYFEFTLPTWNPVAEAPKFYYWGKDVNGDFTSNSITWEADGASNMTLKEDNTYYYEVDASITLEGIIVAFEQDGQFKQSVDVTANLPTEAGKYEVVSTYSSWDGNKFGGVTVQPIVEVSATYMKDTEDHWVYEMYNEFKNSSLGDKADYIPYVAGVESTIDLYWPDDEPEGFYHSISDAPEGYVDNFKALLISVYGYTMTSENVYVNEEVGLQIELVEEDGYQYYYISIVE